MKKIIILTLLLITTAAVFLFITLTKDDTILYSRVSEDSIQVLIDGEYQDIFLKGVNIGATKPGYFPGELAITEAEYFTWFEQIKDMNANTIRVYTILTPAFYNALYDFNKTQDDPLYFMQGVWMNEDDIANISDIYGEDNTIRDGFVSDAKAAVDVIKGNTTLPLRPGFASGVYKKDVSKYMVGWILGIEWDPELVIHTNENNTEKRPFTGTYVYNTEDSSPFEVFLAETAEEIITYEFDNYGTMRPLSYVNWLTTDPLSHPNEPFVNEDTVTVDTEHIKAQDTFTAGMFASYHIYPYYPDFMSYSVEYSQYIDTDGSINTYKAYLEDLKVHHTMPVIVAEFGIPASRGKAHESLYSGLNQGNNTEEMQGEMVVSMLEDIYDSGYAGALIFSWQDEWFKRTWNTNLYDLSHRRPFWSNIQTNEQYFGLLAFDPGAEERISYADGDLSEWTIEDVLQESAEATVSIKSDSRYLYILVETSSFDFDKDVLYIAIDSISGQGNNFIKDTNITLEEDADFIIKIDGENNSKILVDQYYDVFNYLYANIYGFIDSPENYELKNTGVFSNINLPLSYPLYLPQEDRTVDFQSYETGILEHGNGNPSNNNYYSLTDFNVQGNNVELQIPWQLLNFTDPSLKSIMSDIQTNEFLTSETIDSINIGAIVLETESETKNIQLAEYTLQSWELPIYHERLKKSYYIIQDYLKEIS